MVSNITAGVIGCNMNEEFFETSARNTTENFRWKKLLPAGQIERVSGFPDTEIVSDVTNIFNDHEISLVFVSANHLHVVPEVIQAGKSVRVI